MHNEFISRRLKTHKASNAKSASVHLVYFLQLEQNPLAVNAVAIFCLIMPFQLPKRNKKCIRKQVSMKKS